MGRPLKPIDGEQVYKLAKLGCTQVDIAEFFGVDEKTIRNRFSDEFRQGKEQGKISLRHLQWKRAREGSDRMLIHLGQNILGQSQKVEAEVRSESVIFERVDSPRDQEIPAPAQAAGVREE